LDGSISVRALSQLAVGSLLLKAWRAQTPCWQEGELRQGDGLLVFWPRVLVKLCKPGQDERADLPSIGPIR
jgi:hypothetical protein